MSEKIVDKFFKKIFKEMIKAKSFVYFLNEKAKIIPGESKETVFCGVILNVIFAACYLREIEDKHKMNRLLKAPRMIQDLIILITYQKIQKIMILTINNLQHQLERMGLVIKNY